jgi:ATP-dependent Lon protease
MTKFDQLSRMPRDHPSSKKHPRKSKRSDERSKHGHHDDSDDSVDSHGNIRDLIDYGSSEEDEPTYFRASSSSSSIATQRPPRKSAIIARNRIDKLLKKDQRGQKDQKIQRNQKDQKDQKSQRDQKDSTKCNSKNTIHYPSVHKKSIYYPSTPSSTSSSTESPSSLRRQQRYFEEEDLVLSEEETEESTEMEYEEEDEDDLEDEEDEEGDVEEEDEEDEEGDVEEEEEEVSPQRRGFGNILLALMGGNKDKMIPQKHIMSKEPDNVKKFVKLLTTPVEENTIDEQIDQFKGLNDEKQKELLLALERRSSSEKGMDLMLKILMLNVHADVKSMILAKYNSLQSLDTSSNEYFKLRAWLEKVVSMPFGIYKDIPVRIDDGQEKCSDFMKTAKKCLDDAVYGQEDSKLQIMQFIGTKIANPNSRGLSLLFVGPPGVGKTSIIKNGIAKSLGWPFQFISLGGDSDASTYTGHQLVYESSHCGKIVNSLIASKSMSTVLMFDEVDKISQTPKGEEVMNLLIHLTDPVQNGDFEDKYLSGIPIDLSKVMFVFSANDINKIDKVLLDRMIVIRLDGYDLKQKSVIAEQYLLPEALKEVNLTEKIAISKEILTTIIQEFSGDEKGVRELKRCIDQVVQKINMLRLYNSPDLPFHIKEFSLPFIVKKDHIRLFLKKKEDNDAPPHGMYL